ncbi:DNA polymerase III subunit delta' [Marinobacter salexigens]|uniref:DNA polymerase III subunit delta' n=1 Tax=Marinobacter salexigens TaxID=1925763 RepID=UPI000C28AA08|nr:DNA polymerase III subunit delta' [Marinobacter salexigens]
MTDIALEMPWLQKPWQTIQNRLAEGRLPHALLVTGECGVGKRAWADAVSGLLLCASPLNNGSGAIACGQCRQCQLLAASSHPDVRVFSPEKSRMIRIEQIRSLSTFAVSSPQVAGRKIAVVDRADQLNINSANALLKTLEEPVADFVLILLQESGRPVLPTIRSRCQVLSIPVPSAEQADQWLAGKLAEIEGEKQPTAELMAKSLMLAGNAPRLALEYATGEFPALRDEAFDKFRQFMRGQVAVAEAAKAFKALGLEDLLWLFEGWAADLARLSAGGKANDHEAGEMLGFLATNNPAWRAHELLDLVREARSAGVYNVNPELEATRLLIAWRGLMPRKRRAS